MMADKPKIISQGKLQRLVTTDANERAVAPSRAMRWVSAAAFFEVLNCAEAEGRLGAYAIKGGFAVELRHNAAARTSEDIDLILAGEHQAIAILRKILPAKWDAFDFRIKSEDQREHVARVNVQVRFNRVDWGTLKIDVVDARIVDVERVANVAIERSVFRRLALSHVFHSRIRSRNGFTVPRVRKSTEIARIALTMSLTSIYLIRLLQRTTKLSVPLA